MSDTIYINDEYRQRLPPLEKDEREKLKSLILAEKQIRNPLVYWQQTDELLDGHNRYDIYHELVAEGHSIKAPTYKAMSFASKDEALRWMDDNARGQRNLNEKWRQVLIGREYLATKKDEHARPGNVNAKRGGQCDHPDSDRTETKVAKKHGVGEKSVRRAANRAKVFDAIASEKDNDSEDALEVLKVSQKVIDAAVEKVRDGADANELSDFIKKQQAKIKKDKDRKKDKQGLSPPATKKRKRVDTSGLSPFRRDVKRLLAVGKCSEATFWKNVEMLECSSGSEQARKNRHWFKMIVAEVPGLELVEHEDDSLELVSHTDAGLLAAIYHEARVFHDAFKNNMAFEPAVVRAKAKRIIELLSPYISK